MDAELLPEVFRDLLGVPEVLRDEVWDVRFADVAHQLPLRVGEPEVERGADGFAYLRLALPGPGDFPNTNLAAAEPHLLDNLLGAAVTSPDGDVLWTLTHGDLVSRAVWGRFVRREGTDLAASTVSEVLPGPVRRSLRTFLREYLGIETPRAAVVRCDGRPCLLTNLSGEAIGEHEARAGFRALAWVLPRHVEVVRADALARSTWLEDL